MSYCPPIAPDDTIPDAERIGTGVRRRREDGHAFVVLGGRAIVEFADNASLVYLRRGSVYRFRPGAETRWTVSREVELLPVTEASVVFAEHADDSARGAVNGHQAPPVRPFRPRRIVS